MSSTVYHVVLIISLAIAAGLFILLFIKRQVERVKRKFTNLTSSSIDLAYTPIGDGAPPAQKAIIMEELNKRFMEISTAVPNLSQSGIILDHENHTTRVDKSFSLKNMSCDDGKAEELHTQKTDKNVITEYQHDLYWRIMALDSMSYLEDKLDLFYAHFAQVFSDEGKSADYEGTVNNEITFSPPPSAKIIPLTGCSLCYRPRRHNIIPGGLVGDLMRDYLIELRQPLPKFSMNEESNNTPRRFYPLRDASIDLIVDFSNAFEHARQGHGKFSETDYTKFIDLRNQLIQCVDNQLPSAMTSSAVKKDGNKAFKLDHITAFKRKHKFTESSKKLLAKDSPVVSMKSAHYQKVENNEIDFGIAEKTEGGMNNLDDDYILSSCIEDP